MSQASKSNLSDFGCLISIKKKKSIKLLERPSAPRHGQITRNTMWPASDMYCPQCSPMLPTCCYLRSNNSPRYTIRLGLGSFEWCSANLPTDNFRADHVPFHFCIRAQFDVLEIDHYPTIPEDFIRICHPMVRYDLHKSKINEPCTRYINQDHWQVNILHTPLQIHNADDWRTPLPS